MSTAFIDHLADGTTILTATIAQDGSLSNSCFLAHRHFCGVLIPTGWTTAVVTFQGSVDGINFFNVHDSLGELFFDGVAGTCYEVDRDLFQCVKYIKVRSGTSTVSVPQAAARSVKILAA